MSSDELKLPQDERGREALDAYFKAVALYARRRELVERAQASLPEAAADVEKTHQACVDLGLIPANGHRTRTRTPRAASPGASPRPGTVRDRILTAIDNGHTSVAAIAEHAGTTPGTVSTTLRQMLDDGIVARDGERGSYVWRRPEHGEATP